jgi:hypothetical protein
VNNINWHSGDFFEVQPETDKVKVRRVGIEVDQEYNVGPVLVVAASYRPEDAGIRAVVDLLRGTAWVQPRGRAASGCGIAANALRQLSSRDAFTVQTTRVSQPNSTRIELSANEQATSATSTSAGQVNTVLR